MRSLAAGLALACAAGAGAVENDPLPVPKGSPREHAIGLYNHGVLLMLQKHFAAAQQRFEAALALDDSIAEAHNNLAYALRRQGAANHDRALAHYGRALALKPALAEAYVYRGALLASLGRLEEARADRARLEGLNPKLASLLERILAGADTLETTEGLSAQYD